MQPANLINSLQALSRQAKPLIIAENNTPADKTVLPVNKLEAGQKIQATIQEQISPGVFKVQVAGQSMQMQLPAQLKAGNILELKVMSTSPKLTFSFFASSTPIATQEQISSTSRLLANLAELPLGRTLIESTAGHAVWPTGGTAPDSKQLAVALKDALANSGLFYESHQAQWVRGERSTAQLLVEPQNQLAESKIQLNEAQNQRERLTTDPTAATGNATLSKTTTESGLPIARELVPLVQQQLHTLETHQLTWTGQVWPGQTMQWEIEGQPEQRNFQQDERQWSTEMELALPKLGDVHARLVFTRGGIKLTLQAAEANSLELFNRRLPGLRAAISEAGLAMTSAVIEKS